MSDPDASAPDARRPEISLAGAVGAVVIGVALILPFFVRGNPYTPALLRLWAYGTLIVGGLAVLAAVAPVAALRTLPDRMAAIGLRPSSRAFTIGVGVVATGLALLMASLAFGRAPSTADEIAQLWHARILATGRFSLPEDPNPEFFAIDNVIDTGRWYSQFPVGGPLWLVPGVLVGAPWIVNPLLAGLAAAAFTRFARTAFGEAQGRAMGALFALTPAIVLMSATQMNHVPVMFLATVVLAAVAEWDRAAAGRRRLAAAAIAGAAIGAMATIRPLDAVIVGGVAGTFQLLRARGDASRLLDLAVQAAAAAVAVTPLLVANSATTGSAFRFGYEVLWGEAHRIGFHVDPTGRLHSPTRAIEFALAYLARLNHAVMLWPAPLLPALFVGLGAMRRAAPWDRLLLSLVGAQVAGYAAYWHFGDFLGPRFVFTAYPALVALAVRSAYYVGEREGPRAARGAFAFVVACVAGAWLVPVGDNGVWAAVRQVQRTRQPMRLDLERLAREAGVTRGLIFIREPMGERFLHRLWGVGVSRTDAVALLARRDGCGLLEAVRTAEADTTRSRARKAAFVMGSAAPFIPGPENVQVRDQRIRITWPGAITPACRAEFDAPDFVPAFFGAALPREPIGPDGRLEGDVVYAMDLGEHNGALRARFGDRPWYQLVVTQRPGGGITAHVLPRERPAAAPTSPKPATVGGN